MDLSVKEAFLIGFKIIIIIVLTRLSVYISFYFIDKIYKKKSQGEADPFSKLFKYIIGYTAWFTAIISIIFSLGIDYPTIIEYLRKSENIGVLKYIILGIKISIILILTRILIKIITTLIEGFFLKQRKLRFGLDVRKSDTLSELFKNMTRYILYFIAASWILEIAGLDIKTLLAVTSIAGVAIGFGAQNLVKDIIAGFFILFEDQFAVGDFVSVDGMSGIVESLGLRITKIRDFSGDLYIIPNGNINRVTNKSRGNMRALIDLDIAYEEDVDRAILILKEVNEQLKADFKTIVSGPDVFGVTKFNESGITIRTFAKTEPMKQWEIENEWRRRIKQAFDEKGIKFAYPVRRIVSDK